MATTRMASKLTQAQKSALLTSFQKLHELDDEFCQNERDLVWFIFTQLKGLNKHHPNALKNINFVGSLAEGCTLPRVFKINQRFPDNINREVELDVDFKLLEIPQESKSSLEDIKSKRGIVKVNAQNLPVSTLANGIGWGISDTDIEEFRNEVANADGYIQAYKLKSKGGHKLILNNGNKLIELIIAAGLEVKQKDVSLNAKPNTVRKAAITADFMLNVKDSPKLDLSIDFAVIFRINWWPDIYSEFKERKERVWPSQDVIDDLTSYCNIIAKPSDDEIRNMETLEFRYSFSHLEKSLVSMRSRQQMLVYMVFKIVFVKYIRSVSEEVDDGRLTTFLCKNTMFWLCERFPPDLEIWHCDYDAMREAVSLLLVEMLQCLQKGVMPYYFDPKVNLLSGMTDDVMSKASTKIQEMLQDIDLYLDFNMEKENIVCYEILDLVNSVRDVLKEIEKGDYLRLLRQPELILDVIKFLIDEHEVGQRIEKELKRTGKRVEAEVKRSGKKVEEEAKRVGKRVEAEANRSGKKVEAEVKRFVKRGFRF